MSYSKSVHKEHQKQNVWNQEDYIKNPDVTIRKENERMISKMFNVVHRNTLLHLPNKYLFRELGPVVQSPISASPTLNFHPSFIIPLVKSLFADNFLNSFQNIQSLKCRQK